MLWGATAIQIGYVLAYLTIAFFAVRWNRGVLPVASALAVLLAIFAAVAGPSWFARDKSGFAQPAIESGLLGILTLLIVPVQILLVDVRDARLQPGLERRARAPRSRRGARRRVREPSSPSRLSARFPLAYTEAPRAAVAER